MSIGKSDIERMQADVGATLQNHWKLFLVEGIVLVLLGVAAIALPPLATVAVEIVIGWLLLVSGLVGLISTFWMHRAPGFCGPCCPPSWRSPPACCCCAGRSPGRSRSPSF